VEQEVQGAAQVMLEHKVTVVNQELMVLVVLVVQEVMQEIQEMLVQSAILEILELMVLVVLVVLVVLQVQLVIQVLQETLEHQAVAVVAAVVVAADLPQVKNIFIILDINYSNLIMDKMAAQDKRVEIQEVAQVVQVVTDHMLLAAAVLMITDNQVMLDNQVLQVVEATLVVLGLEQHQVVLAVVDNQVMLVQMVLQAIQVLLVMVALVQHQVLEVNQELLAQMV
jgi:hypothetical protein